MQLKRLGVIGCGGHAVNSHILTAPQAGFELTAVFDTSNESVFRAISKWRTVAGDNPTNIQAFDDHTTLLASGLIDAVVITSPDQFHAQQLLDAVSAGVPTLVDKPLAIDDEQMETVREALALAVRANVPVTSCHPRRFDPPYMWLHRNLLRLTRQFGGLIHVELDFSYHIPSAAWKHGRSLLLDHYPHEVDFLRFLLGNLPMDVGKLHDSHDRYTVIGNMGGVSFNCMGTRRLERIAFPEEIRLRFDRGTCAINTETGVAALSDHEHNSVTLEVAGRTDHTLRVEGVMQDFAKLVAGEGSTLTLADLETNTASAIALANRGYYATH